MDHSTATPTLYVKHPDGTYSEAPASALPLTKEALYAALASQIECGIYELHVQPVLDRFFSR